MSAMFARRLVMGFLEVVRVIYFALIGFSPFAIGFLITLGTVVSAFESLIFGVLSDRYGRKPFLLLGSIFAIFRLVLYALSRDFWVLALAQGIGALGEGAGAGQPVVSGYIADKTTAKKRPSVFSVLAITNAISTATGSLMACLPAYFQLSLNIDETSSHIPLFWLGAGINALAVVLVLPIREAKGKRKGAEDAHIAKVSWKDTGRYCLVRATDGFGMHLISPLLPLYFYLRFDADSVTLAPIYALARFLPVFIYLFVPLLVNKFGNVTCLITARVGSGVMIAIFAITSSFDVAAILFVAYRSLLEIAMPMRQTFATEIVDPSQTGALIGISGFLRSMIQSFATTVTGYLFEFVSLTIPFYSGAVMLALNGLQYHVFYGRTAEVCCQDIESST